MRQFPSKGVRRGKVTCTFYPVNSGTFKYLNFGLTRSKYFLCLHHIWMLPFCSSEKMGVKSRWISGFKGWLWILMLRLMSALWFEILGPGKSRAYYKQCSNCFGITVVFGPTLHTSTNSTGYLEPSTANVPGDSGHHQGLDRWEETPSVLPSLRFEPMTS